jgi:hypothetical protein
MKNENAGTLVPDNVDLDDGTVLNDPPVASTAPRGPDLPPRSPLARAAGQRGIFLVTRTRWDQDQLDAEPCRDWRSLHTDRDEAWQRWATEHARCTHEDVAYLIELLPDSGTWRELEGP